jgi:hypothetical protein
MGLHIRTPKDVAFYREYFGSLEGATIQNVRMEQDEYEAETYWPTFDVVQPDGTKYEGVSVSQDEEGNGAGFLHGLPVPGQQEKAPAPTLDERLTSIVVPEDRDRLAAALRATAKDDGALPPHVLRYRSKTGVVLYDDDPIGTVKRLPSRLYEARRTDGTLVGDSYHDKVAAMFGLGITTEYLCEGDVYEIAGVPNATGGPWTVGPREEQS